MKISVLLHEDAKQIILTPENEHEKSALKMIAPGDKIEAQTKWGSIFDGGEEQIVGYSIKKCNGGYYRAYPDNNSLIFLVTKQNNKTNNN